MFMLDLFHSTVILFLPTSNTKEASVQTCSGSFADYFPDTSVCILRKPGSLLSWYVLWGSKRSAVNSLPSCLPVMSAPPPTETPVMLLCRRFKHALKTSARFDGNIPSIRDAYKQGAKHQVISVCPSEAFTSLGFCI